MRHRRESHVIKKETEIGILLPEAKEYLEPPEAKRDNFEEV